MNRFFSFLPGALLLLAGCGGETKPTGTIQGKAFFAGQPIASGKVVFRSPEGMGDDREATISGGAFKIENLPVGPQRVEVTGLKGITAKTKGNGQVVEVKSGNQDLELKLGT